MSGADTRPWLRDAIERIGFAEGERAFIVTADHADIPQAAQAGCGEGGLVVIVEPTPTIADQLLKTQTADNVYVLTMEPDAGHRFGRFDALFGCPTRNPDWELERWAAIVMGNLRPGGRFVLDLPGEAGPGELVCGAWQDADGAPSDLARWSGPAEDELAAALRDAGLRNVEGAVSTHLARVDTPLTLAEFVTEGTSNAADSEFCTALAEGVVRRSTQLSDLEVVFRRTRVAGMR